VGHDARKKAALTAHHEARADPTYIDRLLEIFDTFDEREALVCGQLRFSYRQTRRLILQFAQALISEGLGKGHSVAVFAGNRPEAVVTQLAVHLIGCRLVFAPAELSATERAMFIRRAETNAYVFDPADHDAAQTAAAAGLRRVYSLGPADIGADLLRLAEHMPARMPSERATTADVSTLFYTGGSTGRPKMVLHHHPYYDGPIYSGGRIKERVPRPCRFLLCSTVSHTTGHVCYLMGLLAEGTVILHEGFDPAEVIATIQREQVTNVCLFPPMLYDLLDHPDFPAEGFPSLSRVYCGGGPMNPARLQEAIARFGPVIRQAYGMTEASTIAVMEPHEFDASIPGRLSACGRPVSSLVEVSVRDQDGEVMPGQVGEVCVRGQLVMTGYWKDPDATKEALRDGWLHTGDLGRFDDDGFLHLVDRIRDMIITGRAEAGVYAANIYSNLLEDVATRQPGVRAAAAVGMPDPRYGESVHLVCTVDPGMDVDIPELKKRVIDELGLLYEPQSVLLVATMPKTAIGKVDKKVLRRMLANNQDQDLSDG
jgi:fatty-acyl-CoA synthase